ncbi:retrovirus-related Pol polyprotein from transposon 17.6 [Trichonephila clavipes]|nr:retrovirus-related Pol polyprotein from transposon 17.6 [Trichonephila clavipes]
MPPPPRGSSVARPSQFQEPSSQANIPLLSSSFSINHGNNTQRGTTNLNFSYSRRNSNSNHNSTSGRNATTNPSNSVNCIKNQTNKRALIPAVINNSIEIQALWDPCADITIIQQSCIPADAVIHPWTDGQCQVIDHKINPIGWISLNLSVGNIVHTMPKVGICTHLPFPLILEFDWQQQVQARCTYDSNEDVVLPDLNTKILPSQAQLIPKFAKLSTIQQAQLDAVIGKFSDVFYSDDDNIELCPYIEFKIDLYYDKPIRCRPYRLSEPDRQFLNMQIQKWLKQGICRPSNSTYAAPAFIVEQPFHESTPRRVVIDYSQLIPSQSLIHTQSTIWKMLLNVSYHLKVLYKILEATRNAGFILTPGQTQLAVSEIALFGRILTQDGECPDPDRTASIQRCSTLKSIHEVRSFLGFANQFRKHIQNYAVIAKPLTRVLKETDASYSGLGAVLSQDQNGKRRVIKYVSRTLKDAETRYHSNELECTAVHWALTKKFHLYLLGHKFQLITDNYTTAYVVAKSAVNRKFARPGKQNVIADHLSRFPTPPVCLTVTSIHQSEICTKQKHDDFCQYVTNLYGTFH